MLAGEAAFKVLVEGAKMELYWDNLKKSWVWDDLKRARNYRPVSHEYIILSYLAYCQTNCKGLTPEVH